MTKSVKSAAEQFFNQQSLSEDALKRILETANHSSDMPPPLDAEEARNQTKQRLPIKAWGMAASVLFLSIWLGVMGINQYQHEHRVELIIAEVVKNHGNLKPLEVNASNFNQVVSYFDQLSFLPSFSQVLGISDQIESRLIGGRYCSIQGITAAQLRMQNEQGQYSTLFQTQDAEAFEMIPDIHLGHDPIVAYSKGYQVSMWREKGLLMVMVEPAATIMN